jgi:hypothetical protein
MRRARRVVLARFRWVLFAAVAAAVPLFAAFGAFAQSQAPPSGPPNLSCRPGEAGYNVHGVLGAPQPGGPASPEDALDQYLAERFPGLRGRFTAEGRSPGAAEFLYHEGGATRAAALVVLNGSSWSLTDLMGCTGSLR